MYICIDSPAPLGHLPAPRAPLTPLSLPCVRDPALPCVAPKREQRERPLPCSVLHWRTHYSRTDDEAQVHRGEATIHFDCHLTRLFRNRPRRHDDRPHRCVGYFDHVHARSLARPLNDDAGIGACVMAWHGSQIGCGRCDGRRRDTWCMRQRTDEQSGR